MEKINNEFSDGSLNKIKNIVGVGVMAVAGVAGMAESTPAEAALFSEKGVIQSDGGRPRTQDESKAISSAESLTPSLNSKFSKDLDSKGFVSVEIVVTQPNLDSGNMSFTILLNSKKGEELNKQIKVEVDKSVATNKYAMEALFSGAISKELSK